MRDRRLSALLAALALTACVPADTPPPAGEPAPPPASAGAPPVPAEQPAAELYTVELDFWRTAAFDREGNPVPEEERYETLYDLCTGEPQCRLYTKKENLTLEDGSLAARYWSALRDLNGNPLADWAETSYFAGFGDFVIRCNDPLRRLHDEMDLPPDFQTELWNYSTGRVIPDVDQVGALGEGRALALGVGMKPLGVLDTEGNLLSGFPAPEGYSSAYTYNGHIIAERWLTPEHSYENMETVVLNQKLEPLFSHQIINAGFSRLRGPYLEAEDGNRGTRSGSNRRVLSMEGETLYQPAAGDELEYYDGELLILSDSAHDEAPSLRLVSVDGTGLSGRYRCLEPGDGSSRPNGEAASCFIGLRDEDTVELLNRTGSVIAAARVPGVYSARGCGDAFTFQIEGDTMGLLDAKLNVIIPAEYQYINLEQADTAALLVCQKTLPGGIDRIDVRAPDGTMMVSDLTALGDVGPDRLAVVRGFQAGLMDWQGNWISKQSIFSDFQDERPLFYLW